MMLPAPQLARRLLTFASIASMVSIPACARHASRAPAGDAPLATPGESAGDARIGDATVKAATLAVGPRRDEVREGTREPSGGACPTGMVLVDGDYCPEVEHVCLEWMDPPGNRYHQFRCKRYQKPATCKVPRVHKRFCIDATERAEEATELPRHHISWTGSKQLCESVGGRLCRESEWQFACEGEEMRPYPYGWERDSAACNVDIAENIGRVGRLVDHRARVGSHAQCASPFGVQDMAGNVEEWTQADGPGKGSKMGWKEVLKGSWWIPSRHACRQFQIGHNDVYSGAETGARCCKDAPQPEVAAR